MVIALTLANNKGGVGKSTTAVNLAYGLIMARRHAKAANCRVLLVDTDSQGHSTGLTTGSWDHGAARSLYTVMMANQRDRAQVLLDCITTSNWDEDLHVLPASQLIEKGQNELIAVPGAPYRLADSLQNVQAFYSAIIFDTRPSFSLATEMALLASTDVIIPVEPRYLETVGLMSMIDKVREISVGWRHGDLRVSGLLVTKMDTRIKGHRELLQTLHQHPVLSKLLCGVIPVNEAVAYSQHQHQSVFAYDPTCSASRAYAQLVRTIMHFDMEASRLA